MLMATLGLEFVFPRPRCFSFLCPLPRLKLNVLTPRDNMLKKVSLNIFKYFHYDFYEVVFYSETILHVHF